MRGPFLYLEAGESNSARGLMEAMGEECFQEGEPPPPSAAAERTEGRAEGDRRDRQVRAICDLGKASAAKQQGREAQGNVWWGPREVWGWKPCRPLSLRKFSVKCHSGMADSWMWMWGPGCFFFQWGKTLKHVCMLRGGIKKRGRWLIQEEGR